MKALRGVMKKVSKGEGGFTLIELLIVIIILGILAAVVAFNVSGFLGQGTQQVAETQQANLETAFMAAMADYSSTQISDSEVTIGSSGNDDTDPTSVNLTMSGGETTNLGEYIRTDIHGKWTADENTGLIKTASYCGGGTCFNYTLAGGWVES